MICISPDLINLIRKKEIYKVDQKSIHIRKYLIHLLLLQSPSHLRGITEWQIWSMYEYVSYHDFY